MRSMWKLAVIATAVIATGLACGGEGSNIVDPLGNTAPRIIEVAVDPETVPPGGAAVVRVVAVDTEGDDMTAAATAREGTVVLGAPVASAIAASFRAEKRLTWLGTYANQSASITTDQISVTVRDGKLATSSATSRPLSITLPPPPDPTPTPEPTPEPTPTPGGGGGHTNRSPTVTVSCDPTSCHPKSSTQPCTSACTATAADADNDPLTYLWSGCASGAASTATCTVDDLQTFTATVAVSDGIATATASGTVTGTNATPVSTYSGTDKTPPIPCNQLFGVRFTVTDADGDAIKYAEGQLISGPCTYVDLHPYAGWYQINLSAQSTSGVCRIRGHSSDSWSTGLWVQSPDISVCP